MYSILESVSIEIICVLLLLLLSTREAACFIISFDSVCLYVCLSDDNLRMTSRRMFIFAHPVYLYARWVKFVYEGYRIKVKVTRLKQVHNRYSSNGCVSGQIRFRGFKNFIVNNSASITHTAVKCACSIGFSPTAD